MKIRLFPFGLILLACFSVQAQPSKLGDTSPRQLTAHDLLQACASSYLTAQGRDLRLSDDECTSWSVYDFTGREKPVSIKQIHTVRTVPALRLSPAFWSSM
jgi:hypothetical protein